MPRHTLEASEKPLQDIFCDKYIFSVPSYQRPYSWTTEQTSDLLEDLLTASGTTGAVAEQSPYFLGSVVLIKDPQQRNADIVDGQQRLTTLTILLAIIRDIEVGDFGQSLDNRIRLKGDVVSGTPDTYLLTPRDRDKNFFRTAIQEVGKTADLTPVEAHKDARRSFIGNATYLRDKLLELSAERRRRLASFLIQRCYLVVVSASDRESAFRIFSVLNSRGLDLSPADILKADIIGAIESEQQDQYTETWEDLEDELGRTRFAELFGHIRMIYRRQKLRGTLVSEFKEFVPAFSNPKEFVDTVLDGYATAYGEILEQRVEVHAHAGEINGYLRHLSRLDNVDWQPPAILMLATHRANPSIVLKFLTRLERLAYALFLLREDPTERITRYGRVIQAMEGDDWTSASSPLELTDDEKADVIATLDGPIYTTKRLRVPLLLRLDEAISDQGAIYNHSLLSVEHVLPQNPKENSQWMQDFPEEAQRVSWVHRLANLVLLSRRKNAQASNFDFEEKKSRYFSTRIGVANFAITNSVINESQWDSAILERRQAYLVGRLSELWRLT